MTIASPNTLGNVSRWVRPGGVLTLLVAAASWVVVAQAQESSVPVTASSRLSAGDEETAFMCPMHPDISQGTPGVCGRCGMSLVIGTPFDMRDYGLEVRSEPEVVRAGEPVTLHLGVSHPGTGERINQFEWVHDKLYHFFVLSQDLDYFQHLHPEQSDDGTWAITVTLPKPGHYTLISDFVPSGGTPQFLSTALVTEGYRGDLMAGLAQLVPDEVPPKKTIGSLTASVSFDPEPLVAAMHVHLTFHLADAETDEPATDVQPYLGAYGHMLIVSEDLVDFVHSHPVEMIPLGIDLETARGGPNIVFDGTLPKAGRYRAFAQFRHHDEVQTFPFTFEIGTY